MVRIIQSEVPAVYPLGVECRSHRPLSAWRIFRRRRLRLSPLSFVRGHSSPKI